MKTILNKIRDKKIKAINPKVLLVKDKKKFLKMIDRAFGTEIIPEKFLGLTIIEDENQIISF